MRTLVSALPARVQPYVKGVVAFLVPGVVALVAAVTEASPAGTAITGPEWIGIAAACILTGGATYAAPNLGTVTPAEEPAPVDGAVNPSES